MILTPLFDLTEMMDPNHSPFLGFSSDDDGF